MYTQIFQELNSFLNRIRVPALTDPNAFQSILVKKLSNQNILRNKRRINAGEINSTVNQTHIDITGQRGMLFFFEELNDTSTASQPVDIDLYDNNLRYLNSNDIPMRHTTTEGTTYFVRRSVAVPPHLTESDLTLFSSAYKKYGHAGNQVQINIPNQNEPFTQLQRCAFQDDALVMLKYDYLHYMAILIPSVLCDTLYTITNANGNQNVNYVAENSQYDPALSRQIQRNIITNAVAQEDIAATVLQAFLNNNPNAGTSAERVIKARVSQDSFRKLLLLERHKCALCNITTTSALRASHIKEWSESTREERIDANNGLLLCANHDALFDRHQISFDPDTGNICISASIDPEQRQSLNLSETFNLPMLNRMKAYMAIHHQKFLQKENY